ncbi:hypothetical protein BE04_42455 [Sorangium cellulosum]|uniref:Uncharacterized protein n=1 Tax=Sorangium cellulosum TaxID=56 RepID=A0A150P053_SORCE|nr:hypothetical protein BE04_42455 [Sorangium cellulosum]
MQFNVLKHYHPMIAIPWFEQHQAVFPPVITPVPKVPHIAGGVPLCWGPWGVLSGKRNDTEVSASGGMMMSQGTDIGPLIPHYNLTPPAPPNSLLVVIIPTSGSKSHFGAHGHVAPKGPIAFACAKVVNFNLNCAGPAWPPLPSGVVPAFNTHTVGVTVGDLVAGALHMFVDGLIQFGLNRLFAWSRVGDFFENVAQRALGPGLRALGYGNVQALVEYGLPGLGRLGRYVGSAAEEFLFNLPGTLVAVGILGSPVGWSPGYTLVGGHGGNAVDAGHGAVQKAVDNYFNSPTVEQHPSHPPASAQPPASAPPANEPPANQPPGQ